jgi:hypothetical protein
MSRGIAIRLLAAASTLACLACATTTFESTWKSPDAQPLRLTGRKVVTVFVSRDPLLRRRAEDAMAREVTARGAYGVPAYTFLSDQEIRDRDAAKTKADALGFAGAVVMRVVGSETIYTDRASMYVWAGPEYRRFWGGYWGWGWAAAWQPGTLAVNRIVKVETLVYSLEQDQLVWGGVSRTFEPSRIEDFIAELAVAVSKQMADDGVLTRS